jgi:hypothetical protein
MKNDTNQEACCFKETFSYDLFVSISNKDTWLFLHMFNELFTCSFNIIYILLRRFIGICYYIYNIHVIWMMFKKTAIIVTVLI